MPDLSVVIIVHNEEKNIRRCLESVQDLASEIVVVDSQSTDRTGEICLALGCRLIPREFDGYGTQKQFAVDQAIHDWIFSIDADEEVTPGLKKEIRELFSRPVIEETGFEICFSLVYLGRKLNHGGAGGDYHLRLFNRNAGGFTKVKVHEGIHVSGQVKRLTGEVLHYSYRNLAHHLEKLNDYSTRAAEGYVQQGRRYSRAWAVLKFPISFLQFYCCKAGFLDGYPGFMWSLMGALYASLKIAKSIELREERQ
ncbi:MAG: glycosyltransferase family 2 protein [Bacteroidetes bacterium]|nr:MAG: glycosyltransferase family 2 protein [Bacteroidota bacterium]